MTARTILSRSGRIAVLVAGAILLTYTGAASARGGGGGRGHPPPGAASTVSSTVTQPVNSQLDPPGGTKSSGNGLPSTPGGNMSPRGPVRILEY